MGTIRAAKRERGECLEAGCHEPVKVGHHNCETHLVKNSQATHRYKLRTQENERILTKTLRAKVIAGYGGCCKCCGESMFEFLTIDHVNGDGYLHPSHRKGGRRFYTWILKAGFPPSLQVLCYNCNCAKKNFAECPHRRTVVNMGGSPSHP